MRNSWATRLGAAALLWGCGALYSALFEPATFPSYYFIVALFDAAMIFAYRVCLGQNALVHDLQRINFVSIGNHAFGFTLYMLHHRPYLYNTILAILQAAEWIRIIMVRTDDKLPTNYWRFDMVRDRIGSRPKRFAETKNL